MKLKALLFLKKTVNSCDWRHRLPVALMAVFLVACRYLPAQSLPGLLGNGPQGSASPHAPADSLHRTTPRSAILNFLEACRSERYVVASRYLDLSKISADDRQTQGPELARQLADILNKDPRFEVDQLSDDPAGESNDGLAPNTEVLLKVNGNDDESALLLERIEQQGVQIWLVSAASVLRMNAWASCACCVLAVLPVPMAQTGS